MTDSSSIRIDYSPFGPQDRPRAPKVTRTRRLRNGGIRLLRLAATLLIAAVLPFLVLVRLSVFLYGQTGWGSWGAVLGSATATGLLLSCYVWWFRIRRQGRLTVPRAALKTIAILVGAYLLYALVYLSSAQAKSDAVRGEFRGLHPVMRVAVSTLLIADRSALVTDLGRSEADYRAWGLPVNEASLHFEQDNGWVHAVDLRTVGRPEWRNRVLHLYFWGMGFRTLRHMGTADHLHVSLPVS